ncbi:acyltransferase [Photorhabdus bodei]|uniref:Acetyltransferase n=1 Tax=Photorhabdus bodei TaxID=2029681 RepID=A0A329XF03_9GAMM|nr:acyltransferase family protein [Photorhabdus bodei]NDK97866.1 acyltransferase family protein [Photorhabdus bodei]NDL02116.1 acyltransferase family protein [Photorhabdus bodei]NDL06190.1 acyltransferase family protein [Photorhabdus bodei]RAX14380.1 acetyltransferase [Photorhabdus bodei]
MRILAIDLLKIVSIFFVVISHVTLFFLLRDDNDVVLYFLRQAGQLGVSLFFMCSGYFLLNNKHEKQVDYIINKSKGILTVLLFWLIFYYLYDTYFISKFTTVPTINFLNYVNVSITTSDATHLWFIFAIVSLYILTPLMRNTFNETNAKGIKKILVIMLIISNLTLLNALTDYKFSFSLIPFNILFPFQSEGLISFLIGGYIGLTKPKIKAFSCKHIILLVFFIISLISLSIISSKTGMTFFYGKFYNVFLQASSVCLFLFLVNLNVREIPFLIDDISKNILGIYLVHNIFVIEIHNEFIHNFLLKKFNYINVYVYIIAYSLLAFILSYILCVLLRKSKITSKIITI